jgi:hypothetical protein
VHRHMSKPSKDATKTTSSVYSYKNEYQRFQWPPLWNAL